ncbi:MAG: hypothetical protein U0794_14060 [Isosphaeraceae bacterium]
MYETNSVPDAGAASATAEGEVAVKIRGVTKHFGSGENRVMAARGVDWDVPGATRCRCSSAHRAAARPRCSRSWRASSNADSGSVSVFGEK